MPTLASYLSGKSPAYAAARRKHGIADDMLVTPPGLMPGARRPPVLDQGRANAAYNAFRPGNALGGALAGQPAAPTVTPLRQALAPPPRAPLSDPAEAQAYASRWNAMPGTPGAIRHGASTAIAKPGGGVRLEGSGGAYQAKFSPEQRNAYLAQQAEIQSDRSANVFQNAFLRGQERKERLATRRAGPSPLDLMAARDPRLALGLASLNQQGRIAAGDQALRRDAAQMQYAGLGEQRTAEAGFRNMLTQNPALAAIALGGLPEGADIGQFNRQFGGQGGETTIGALPLQQQQQIDAMPLPRAAEALAAQGVPQEKIRQYQQQRQQEFQAENTPNSLWQLAPFVPIPGIQQGALAARIRGLFDPKPVGPNPEVVKRLTPQQRAKLGIPAPSRRKAPSAPRAQDEMVPYFPFGG